MSGTSADAVDAALLCTDGEVITAHGGGISLPYEENTARLIHAAMRGQADHAIVAHALTIAHVDAVKALLQKQIVPQEAVRLIGFHGQTVYHNPKAGVTVQLGDASLLAAETAIPVVADFRSRDVAEGGEGAPLVPLYHQALLREKKLATPVAVLNLGGVANITYIEEYEAAPIAFDCGPANALMDDVMRAHHNKHYDEEGRLAASGTADMAVVQQYMQDVFFTKAPPKSLDRNHFPLAPVQDLPVADALASLAAFTVEAVAHGLAQMPKRPETLLVAGGGRHNAYVMQLLSQRLNMPVKPVEAAGFDGDLLEAEAFAYLAARSVRGLPLSLPTTTGVRQAVTGGAFYQA